MTSEYIVDGLRYCEECNKPTQCRVTLFGKERIQTCLCECGKKRRDEDDLARKRSGLEYEYGQRKSLGDDDFQMFNWFNCHDYSISPRLRHERAELLKRLCFPEAERKQLCTFENDNGGNEKIMAIAKDYVDNFDDKYEKGLGLLLFGETGTGKSFTAACIANELLAKDRPVHMTHFERLFNTLWDLKRGKQEFLDNLNKFDLLVIDDLGAENTSDYTSSVIFNVVETRLNAGLPMIITTNLTRSELLSTSDMRKKRIYSRLFECCIPLEVDGADRRKDILAENMREFKEKFS
jgi:DNA replication protein DnaC